MKRILIAAAVLSAATAHAQSSVTLFGVVDATLARGIGSVASKTQLTNSGNASSRLGVRGVEDLGGGMSASFWLEAALNNDNGTGAVTNSNNQASGTSPAPAGGPGLIFNRRSTVSLSGPWGEARLGRDYTPHFWNTSLYDPFGLVGVGTNHLINSPLSGPTAARASNGISYFLPSNLGGFHGQIQYAMGENTSGTATSRDGNMLSARVGYVAGPFDIAATTGKTRFSTGNITVSNLSAAYKLDTVRLTGELYQDKVASATPLEGRGFMLGASVGIGAGEVRASYSRHKVQDGGPRTGKAAVGYVYNLSKRTAVYTTYARLSNAGGAAVALNGGVTGPNQRASGLDIGLRHAF